MHHFDAVQPGIQAGTTQASSRSGQGRSAAVAIAGAAVISTVAVALDQGASGNNPAEILASIASIQQSKALVHAIAIASVCAMAYGYSVLARKLDLQRPAALAGLVLYLFGSLAMVGAAVLDGFVIPHVAADGATAAPERLAFAYNLAHYAGVALNDLARVAWVLQAAGTLAWSLLLLRVNPFARKIGFVGFLSSALVIALVLASPVDMGLAPLLSILVAQLLWNLAAAVLLFREERGL